MMMTAITTKRKNNKKRERRVGRELISSDESEGRGRNEIRKIEFICHWKQQPAKSEQKKSRKISSTLSSAPRGLVVVIRFIHSVFLVCFELFPIITLIFARAHLISRHIDGSSLLVVRARDIVVNLVAHSSTTQQEKKALRHFTPQFCRCRWYLHQSGYFITIW